MVKWQRVLVVSAVAATGFVPVAALASGPGEQQTAGSGYPSSDLGTDAAGPPVPVPAGMVEGRDVSQYQGTISQKKWSALRAGGVRFAIIRSTMGIKDVDTQFARNYSETRAAGIVRGAYAFARPDEYSSARVKRDYPRRGGEQADFLLAHGGGWSPGGWTLPAALDLESDGGDPCYHLTKKAMVAWIKGFSDRYVARTGRHPLLYTNPSWWARCVGGTAGTAFRGNPLWIANWQHWAKGHRAALPARPVIPAGFATYRFWQYQSGSHDPGRIDRDAFAGSPASLAAYARRSG